MAASEPLSDGAYEPGGRYEPRGPSVRGFLAALVVLAALWAADDYLDQLAGPGASRLLTDGVWVAVSVWVLIRALRGGDDWRPDRRRFDLFAIGAFVLITLVGLFIHLYAFVSPE